jgi:hypothetical protein
MHVGRATQGLDVQHTAKLRRRILRNFPVGGERTETTLESGSEAQHACAVFRSQYTAVR